MSDTSEPTTAPTPTPATSAPAAPESPAAAAPDAVTAAAAETANASKARPGLDHRIEEVKATARKAWTSAVHLGERARAEATKVTTRGRERWSVLAPRAKQLSERTRTRVAAVWKEQVAGARAGLARVRAVLGKRG